MTDQTQHALFSPSSAVKWSQCEGALAMEDGLKDSTSDYAEEGTAAHELASWALNSESHWCEEFLEEKASNGIEITEEMCAYVQEYVDNIIQRKKEYYLAGAKKVTMLVEYRIDFPDLLGISNQFGTLDAVMLVEWKDGTALIEIDDLKYGYNRVYAEQNEQLCVYALAALERYGLIANFTTARLVIHQPRLNHVDEWTVDFKDLEDFSKLIKEKANRANDLLQLKQGSCKLEQHKVTPIERLTPGEKQCRWCKRNGDCPALTKWAGETIGTGLDSLTEERIESKFRELDQLNYDEKSAEIARLLKAHSLLELFTKSIWKTAVNFAENGGEIEGWKMVTGRQGNRKFNDEKEVEALLKDMRLKYEDIYTSKLKSPAQLEKTLKKQNPRRWEKIESLIVRSEGRPTLVPDTDRRKPLDNTFTGMFDVLPE